MNNSSVFNGAPRLPPPTEYMRQFTRDIRVVESLPETSLQELEDESSVQEEPLGNQDTRPQRSESLNLKALDEEYDVSAELEVYVDPENEDVGPLPSNLPNANPRTQSPKANTQSTQVLPSSPRLESFRPSSPKQASPRVPSTPRGRRQSATRDTGTAPRHTQSSPRMHHSMVYGRSPSPHVSIASVAPLPSSSASMDEPKGVRLGSTGRYSVPTTPAHRDSAPSLAGHRVQRTPNRSRVAPYGFASTPRRPWLATPRRAGAYAAAHSTPKPQTPTHAGSLRRRSSLGSIFIESPNSRADHPPSDGLDFGGFDGLDIGAEKKEELCKVNSYVGLAPDEFVAMSFSSVFPNQNIEISQMDDIDMVYARAFQVGIEELRTQGTDIDAALKHIANEVTLTEVQQYLRPTPFSIRSADIQRVRRFYDWLLSMNEIEGAELDLDILRSIKTGLKDLQEQLKLEKLDEEALDEKVEMQERQLKGLEDQETDPQKLNDYIDRLDSQLKKAITNCGAQFDDLKTARATLTRELRRKGEQYGRIEELFESSGSGDSAARDEYVDKLKLFRAKFGFDEVVISPRRRIFVVDNLEINMSEHQTIYRLLVNNPVSAHYLCLLDTSTSPRRALEFWRHQTTVRSAMDRFVLRAATRVKRVKDAEPTLVFEQALGQNGWVCITFIGKQVTLTSEAARGVPTLFEGTDLELVEKLDILR